VDPLRPAYGGAIQSLTFTDPSSVWRRMTLPMTEAQEFLALVAVAVRARTWAPQGYFESAQRAAARLTQDLPPWDAAAVFVRWLYKEGYQTDRWILKILRPDEP
jgi:hypothetical protein